MSELPAIKTIEQNFQDWESYMFGYGYGTGEEHTLGALKTFFSAIGRPDNQYAYDYKVLEQACGPAVAWLLINALGSTAIDYGTSPRYGWLTPEGEALKNFFSMKSLDELYSICCDSDGVNEGYYSCFPDHCNCEGSFERKCKNPFWVAKVDRP